MNQTFPTPPRAPTTAPTEVKRIPKSPTARSPNRESSKRPRALAARELSRQLREEVDPTLQRRRWLVGLSLVGATLGEIVSLYQMGIIKRLPDLPFEYFDATKVDASDYAYKRLQTPDALLMVASYALTAILAGAGGKDRARTQPLLPLALAAKTVGDAVAALKLGREEWAENRALCGYCQGATLVSLVSVALALPEALQAVHTLRNNG